MQIRTLKSVVITLALLTGLAAYCHADDATTQPATSQPTTTAAVVPWEEAGKHDGETITVTGPVIGNHTTKNGDLVLNIGKDFPDKTRFTVFIGSKDQDGLPEDKFKDATITVTGKIKMFKEVPEIVVKAKDVVVAPK